MSVLTSRSHAHHFGPTKTAPHYVYRCYDADGDLIYIGCTVNVNKRIGQHRRGGQGSSASRWLAVCMDRYEVEGPYDGRDAGLAAEAAAIAVEAPVFNQNMRRSDHPVALRAARADIARYLLERGHVELARATACTCWRETRDAGARDVWCPAHRDEDRPLFDDIEDGAS